MHGAIFTALRVQVESLVITGTSPPPSLESHSYRRLSECEIVMETFHQQLLASLSPTSYSVELSRPCDLSSSLSPPLSDTLFLYYVTSAQLKTLLDSKETPERDLNSKSGAGESVICRLGSELGPLLSSSDSLHSDLIPTVYEGGMKVWDCAYDLVDYLVGEDSLSLVGCRILELGCGVGLPGILSLLLGAESVHFHDYNREVLSCLTIPSLLASFISGRPDLKSGLAGRQTGVLEQLAGKTKFYFGDWADFVASHGESGEPPYDIILTSETIYSVSSQLKLLRALKKLTNQSKGVVVMATKAHYFGVGGSVAMFRDLATSDGHFETTVLRDIKATIPRVILLMKPKF